MDETRPEGRQERLENLRSLYASGRYQEALAVCSQFADKNPEPNTVLIYRGMIHRALGSPAEALPAFEEWVKREPGSAAAWNHLGIVLAELRLWPRAHVAFEEALAICPGDGDALCNLGGVLVELGRAREAQALLMQGMSQHASNPMLWLNLGCAERALGSLEMALERFDRALSVRGDWHLVHSNKLSVLSDLGRYEEALLLAETLVARGIRDLSLDYGRAIALMGLQRYEESLTLLDQILIQQPSHLDALGQRGRCLLFLGHRVAGLRNEAAAYGVIEMSSIHGARLSIEGLE